MCLRGEDVAALYVSPAARTRMTAGSILAFHGNVSAQVEPGLRERRFGIWEGLTFREIEEGYADLYKAWKMDQAGFVPEGGESIFDVQVRLEPVIERIVSENRGRTAVVVAHVGPIRTLVAQALGGGVKEYRRFQVDPASIAIVDYGVRQNNLILLNYRADFFGARASQAGCY